VSARPVPPILITEASAPAWSDPARAPWLHRLQPSRFVAGILYPSKGEIRACAAYYGGSERRAMAEVRACLTDAPSGTAWLATFDAPAPPIGTPDTATPTAVRFFEVRS